ncbi:unnamed protein product [Phytophthora fragariaefolia]|uniref:Unnamed protein product n=1 Tax=Phytophthora fragariaefolia TaxID=1490495 RepID=A0A9W6XY07_9STRA|nr:unnamed protein product [Phytophthora fragariaefolia]
MVMDICWNAYSRFNPHGEVQHRLSPGGKRAEVIDPKDPIPNRVMSPIPDAFWEVEVSEMTGRPVRWNGQNFPYNKKLMDVAARMMDTDLYKVMTQQIKHRASFTTLQQSAWDGRVRAQHAGEGPADANLTPVLVDFLAPTPEKPEISVAKEVSKEEARGERWRNQHWTRAHAALLNLVNQSMPNVFMSTLPDQVSTTKPCDVWKELEQRYGLGGAGGIIELRCQWKRLTTSNWSDLGSLFAHLKKLRNDIYHKMKGLIVPRKRSSYGRTRGVPVAIGVDKKTTGRKRNQDDSSGQGSDECFYCFHTGHRKVDCPMKVKDRDPNGQGGPLFRTNIRTLPGGGKQKRLMTVKKP